MLTIETRPSRTVDGITASKWVAAGNPIVFGFHKSGYVPDPAYQINVKVYESGTNKLLGKLTAKPFTNGRVKVDVSGILRGYLANENPFAYNVVNLTSARSSIKFYLVYEEVVIDPSQVSFSGYANMSGNTRLIGTAPKASAYSLSDEVYLHFNAISSGPWQVVGFDSASLDVIINLPYIIPSTTGGKLSLLSSSEKFVSVSDIANAYWAVLAVKQPGELYGQNMGGHVPFGVENLPTAKRARWLTDFERPVYWATWPFAVDFIYGEGLKGITVSRVEQGQTRNGVNSGSPLVTALNLTQIETVNRLTLSGNYGEDVAQLSLKLRTGDYSPTLYVAPGYVTNAYVEIQ